MKLAQNTQRRLALLPAFALAWVLSISPAFPQTTPPPALWAITAGGTQADEALSVTRSAKGNICYAGYFQGTATFGNTNLTSQGVSDIFVTKCNANGTTVWAKHPLSQSGVQSRAYAVACDNNENAYITGSFEGTTVFDSISLSTDGNDNFFVAKYDPSGSVLWAKRAGGIANSGRGIAVDSAGDVFATGAFHLPATFDGITLTGGNPGYDIFLVKYDPNGNVIWARKATGSGGINTGQSVAVDASGNCFVTGTFEGSVNFSGVVLNSAGGDDLFLAKYDNTGTLLWVRDFGGTGNDSGRGVSVDASGKCLVTGSFSGSISASTNNLTSNGGQDLLVLKYDTDGTLRWAWGGGGPNDDFGNAIGADSVGDCFAGGSFSGTANFGTNSFTSAGGTDVVVVKLDSNGSLLWATQPKGSGDDVATGISVASDASFFLSGSFSNTNSFGQNVTSVSAGGLDAFVAQYPGRPQFLTQPMGQITNFGASVFLSASALGQPSIYFQWRRNGNLISGATNTSFAITNLQFATCGQYSLVASNSYGLTVSSNAAVTVNDNGDLNNNGIPDWWEALYGLNPEDPTNTTNHPSGDLLNFGQKYFCGLDPLTPDTDGDGLSDYDELFVYGTDPLKPNTSGDDIPDGWKVQFGLNARVANANDEISSSGVTYWQVYQYNLTHTNQLDARNPFFSPVTRRWPASR